MKVTIESIEADLREAVATSNPRIAEIHAERLEIERRAIAYSVVVERDLARLRELRAELVRLGMDLDDEGGL